MDDLSDVDSGNPCPEELHDAETANHPAVDVGPGASHGELVCFLGDRVVAGAIADLSDIDSDGGQVAGQLAAVVDGQHSPKKSTSSQFKEKSLVDRRKLFLSAEARRKKRNQDQRHFKLNLKKNARLQKAQSYANGMAQVVRDRTSNLLIHPIDQIFSIIQFFSFTHDSRRYSTSAGSGWATG